MKILFNRISNKISGAEIYNLYLLKALKKIEDLRLIFSSDNKELNERIRDIGVRVVYINPHIEEIGTKRQFIKALLSLPSYYLAFIGLIKSTDRQDLLIFESMNEKLFLTFPLRFLRRKKVIWIEHGPLFETQRAKMVKILYWINTCFVNKIICVSKSTENDLILNGIKSEKTSVIHIGIDTKSFSPLSFDEKFRIKSRLKFVGKNIVGFLGTVNQEKGIKDFLEVATLCLKEKKNVIFLVVGDGSQLNWLKDEVIKKGINSHFYFTNRVKRVKDFVGIMDVLLFPTHHQEGLSLSLLEANAMGVPAIATDIGGNREIIKNKVNGILYSDSSPSKIKKIIDEVLSKKRAYSKEARISIEENFSLEKCSNLFYSMLSSIFYGN